MNGAFVRLPWPKKVDGREHQSKVIWQTVDRHRSDLCREPMTTTIIWRGPALMLVAADEVERSRKMGVHLCRFCRKPSTDWQILIGAMLTTESHLMSLGTSSEDGDEQDNDMHYYLHYMRPSACKPRLIVDEQITWRVQWVGYRDQTRLSSIACEYLGNLQ
jgi:hypothetical protein